MRTLATVLFAALVVAAPAFAAYPGTYAMTDGSLVGGSTRYMTSATSNETQLVALNERTSARLRSTTIPGAYGVATLIPANLQLGMFRDGSSFVLQSLANTKLTRFVVVLLFVEHDEARGIGIGERLEQNRTHHGEQGDVGADAEGHDEDGDDGETGLAQQRANAEAEVAKQRFDSRPVPGFVSLVSQQGGIAE